MDPTQMMINFLEQSMNEHVRKACETFELLQQLRAQQAAVQQEQSLLKPDTWHR